MSLKSTSFKAVATLVIGSFLLSGCSPSANQEAPVGVQLFMYNWVSVGKECKQTLGPAGIDYAFISPAQEHIQLAPWWVHYQPVSYQIESRLGTREQFKQMVRDCNSAGVKIIADAVINHMAASEKGIGWAGTSFTKYSYPGLYEREDFHSCSLTKSKQIENYRNLLQVQTCELLGLPDLATKEKKVQETIASYLKDLLSLGVAGFRIDAAKHIWTEDLREIIELLPENTLIFHEVIRGAGEPVQPEGYVHHGDLWEFSYARDMRSYFTSGVITPALNQARYQSYLPSESAISFITNHDTERNGEALNLRLHAKSFELATAMMLADPYGMPMLYGGYSFTGFDDAPPLNSDGTVSDVECLADLEPRLSYEPGSWPCPYQWKSTQGMIEFRKVTGVNPKSNTVKATGLVGWGRGSAGFFAVNISKNSYQVPFESQLIPGSYCDSITGGSKPIENNRCKGLEITVLDGGLIEHTLDANSAFAIHEKARLR